MKVYIGTLINPVNSARTDVLLSHALGVESDGVIAFVKPASEYTESKSDEIVKLEHDQFLVPGFVDTHIHAPQYPNCGIFGDSTLLDWLERYTFPLESKFKDTDLAYEVYSRLVDRQLANGTTTSSYFGTIHVPSTLKLAEVCLERGQRALVGRVCMERFCPESLQDKSIEPDLKFIEAIKELDPTQSLVKPVITPRFAPSCSFETLCKLGELAKTHKLPVQTHINENKNEIEWVAELFPEASSYTDVYDRASLLKQDTVLAHGIHFTEAELKTVKARNSGISHCPNSNASIASGIAPIKKYLEMGIKVGLGTDVSGGSTPSILKNARLALLMSRLLSERLGGSTDPILSVSDVLYIATLGGAETLDLADQTGNFCAGKCFDAQLVDVKSKDSPIDVFEVALPERSEDRVWNLVQKWLYVGDDRNTLKVWVRGKLVHERA